MKSKVEMSQPPGSKRLRTRTQLQNPEEESLEGRGRNENKRLKNTVCLLS